VAIDQGSSAPRHELRCAACHQPSRLVGSCRVRCASPMQATSTRRITARFIHGASKRWAGVSPSRRSLCSTAPTS
jgi:hypothetical protein